MRFFPTSFTIFHCRGHGNIPGYHPLSAWIEFNTFMGMRISLVVFHRLNSRKLKQMSGLIQNCYAASFRTTKEQDGEMVESVEGHSFNTYDLMGKVLSLS